MSYTNEQYNEDLKKSRARAEDSRPINPGSKNKKELKKSGIARKKTFNIFALLGQMNLFKDQPYLCMIVATILKEIIDVVCQALVILYPLSFIVSILNTIFGIMMMQLAKFSEVEEKVHGKLKARLMLKIALWVAGSLFDSFPGLGVFPISIIVNLLVYLMVLYERANTEKTEKAAA